MGHSLCIGTIFIKTRVRIIIYINRINNRFFTVLRRIKRSKTKKKKEKNKDDHEERKRDAPKIKIIYI